MTPILGREHAAPARFDADYISRVPGYLARMRKAQRIVEHLALRPAELESLIRIMKSGIDVSVRALIQGDDPR